MAKVQVNQTPSEQITSTVRAEISVTDETGRVIVIRRPSLLSEFDLYKALGDAASNTAYMSMAVPLLHVKSIDGVIINPPKSSLQVDSLITKLDRAGWSALFEGMKELHADASAPQSVEAAPEELKN